MRTRTRTKTRTRTGTADTAGRVGGRGDRLPVVGGGDRSPDGDGDHRLRRRIAATMTTRIAKTATTARRMTKSKGFEGSKAF